MAVPRPSEDAPTPRITAYTWSPSRSASSIRLSANMTTPSPSIVPSAAAENGRQSPVDDSAGVLVKQRYMEMSLEVSTPPVITRSDRRSDRSATAEYSAASELAQAASVV